MHRSNIHMLSMAGWDRQRLKVKKVATPLAEGEEISWNQLRRNDFIQEQSELHVYVFEIQQFFGFAWTCLKMKIFMHFHGNSKYTTPVEQLPFLYGILIMDKTLCTK